MENNQNLDENVNSTSNEQPYAVIDKRNPFMVLFFSVVTGFISFSGFMILISIFFGIAQIVSMSWFVLFILIVIFIFSLYGFFATILFQYVKSYKDRIIIKKYFFDEIVIYRKDIIWTQVSGTPFNGDTFNMLVKRKIGVRFFSIFCLSGNQCYGI
ncbi:MULTISPECIES: hypothetical protein [unclassified Campylobacter]|uniref:hypothetical protein n=1 Tax=unclassified Campylobacter TaxID=2593542 RepID=UPI0022E99BCC|nr:MULTISPECIES: hypothetical protein [unclassified Campylobacter]MDA3079646.1 hypothetical protein [Campylobacter sp. CS_NA2]MDA3080922.1 hypothetical protein [Campylobacter sp. CS_NA1]MDA3085473.1 hypothetical protein [Campylobacter sp. CS_ED1]MDA3090478.1 hypothetical protein [Campylobacter sp. CS_ED2]WBR50740.1 hypothetical protein PF026_05130 [Campylobacter sp. CS_NA3]